MSVEENKARYDGSVFQQLVEQSGHTICNRCYCCDSSVESYPCWQCCGFEEEDDEWYSVCSVCHGEGEIYVTECLGRCDENGNHQRKFSGESDGSEVPTQMSADGVQQLNRSKTEDGQILRPGMQAEGSPRNAQER